MSRPKTMTPLTGVTLHDLDAGGSQGHYLAGVKVTTTSYVMTLTPTTKVMTLTPVTTAT